MRNLVEYTGGETDPKFLKLTSMLHCRPDSATLTEGDLDQIYNGLFSTKKKAIAGKLIMDLIHEQAASCLDSPGRSELREQNRARYRHKTRSRDVHAQKDQ